VTSLSAVVEIEVQVPQALAFMHIVPIDLSSIFTGYGPLPSITGTHNQTGAWDAAGQTRTVSLSDGSSAHELITKYEYPGYFRYTVSGFTGMLGLFTGSANGEWWFQDNPSSGNTRIKWRYAFNARAIWSVPILWIITNVFWRGYMQKALILAKKQIESNAT
jgi:hypothetical protein